MIDVQRLPEDQKFIRKTSLLTRMPVKVEPSANGTLTRKPLVKTNTAAAGRQNRLRKQDGPKSDQQQGVFTGFAGLLYLRTKITSTSVWDLTK